MTNDTEIIIQENEIKFSNFKLYIDVLNEMITELAFETEAYIPDIIRDIAKYYRIPLNRLISELKRIDSPYAANNGIVYYFNENPVRRTAYTCAQRKVIMKLGNILSDAYEGIEDATAQFMNNIKLHLSTKIVYE